MAMDYKDLCKHLLALVGVVLKSGYYWIRIISKELKNIGLTWLGITSSKGIANISSIAETNWAMIIDTTVCVCTANSLTRINTFLIYASFVLRTFRTDYTFRATARWGANISGKTRTHSLTIHFSTLRVWSAGRGLTRIYVLLNHSYCKMR